MEIHYSLTPPKYFPIQIKSWNILENILLYPKNILLVFTEQRELDVNVGYLKEIASFKVNDTTMIFWFPANMLALEFSWCFSEEAV